MLSCPIRKITISVLSPIPFENLCGFLPRIGALSVTVLWALCSHGTIRRMGWSLKEVTTQRSSSSSLREHSVTYMFQTEVQKPFSLHFPWYHEDSMTPRRPSPLGMNNSAILPAGSHLVLRLCWAWPLQIIRLLCKPLKLVPRCQNSPCFG